MIRKTPEGYHTVSPWLISRDTARLSDFLVEAFAGEELARLHNDDGSVGHAEVRVGDSVVLMFDARPHWPETPGFLRLYVEDGAATYERALRAGATPVTELTLLPFGDRVARVRDPLGNVWWIQSVYVRPEARRQRIYNGMYEHVRSLIQDDESVRGIRLYVDRRNTPAQEVYRRCGMNGDHYLVFEWMK